VLRTLDMLDYSDYEQYQHTSYITFRLYTMTAIIFECAVYALHERLRVGSKCDSTLASSSASVSASTCHLCSHNRPSVHLSPLTTPAASSY